MLEQYFEITATIGAGVIALFTMIKAYIEYAHQGTQKRAEFFVQLRVRFRESDAFKLILSRLDENENAIGDISLYDRTAFAALLEEIALLYYSGLLRRNVTFYMFGMWVEKCWNCDAFWKDFGRFRNANGEVKWSDPLKQDYWVLLGRFSSEITAWRLKNSKEISFKL